MVNNNEDDTVVLALAGNKADIDPAQKKVNFMTAKEVASKQSMVFSETSAKTGEGIQELFKKVAERIVKERKEQDGI